MILVDDEYRKLSKDDPDIQALAEDIRANGLIQAIGVNRHHEIVWGRKRLFATKEVLGLGNIDCKTVDVEGDEKELKTIAENLFRKNLDFWERGEMLQRYYQLMSKKYPDRYNPDGTRVTGRKPETDEDTSEGVGMFADGLGSSRRTVYEELQVARNLDTEVKSVLKKHATTKQAALLISRLPLTSQKKIAAKLESNEKTANIKKVLAEFNVDPERSKAKLWKELKDKKDTESAVIDVEPAFAYQMYGAGKLSKEISLMPKARTMGVNALPVQLIYSEKLDRVILVYYHTPSDSPPPKLLQILHKAEKSLRGKGNLGIHVVSTLLDERGERFIINNRPVNKKQLESFLTGSSNLTTYKK